MIIFIPQRSCMKKIYVSIVAGMAISAATAQQTSLANNTAPGGGYDAAPALSMDTYPTDAAAEAADAAPALHYYSGDGRRGTVFANVEAGVITATYMNDTATRTGSGGVWKAEIGWRRTLPARNENKYNFFGLSLAYSDCGISEYITINGNKVEQKNIFTTIHLPVSYSSVGNQDKAGFFWQVGTNINYNVRLKSQTGTLIHSFSRLWIEPNVSLGISFRYVRNDLEMRGLLGPYVGYSITNLAKNDGESTRFLNIGIKYTSMIF